MASVILLSYPRLHHYVLVVAAAAALTLSHLPLSISAENTYTDSRCGSNTNAKYANSSAYQANLNSVLSTLAADTTIDYGFYNSSAGNVPDTVYSIALCRGDTSTEACRDCINVTREDILRRCPNYKEAVVWYELCMLRFSGTPIFAMLTYVPELLDNYSNESVKNATGFEDAMGSLFVRLNVEAAAGNSTLKFASSYEDLASSMKVYAQVQCTPDLSQIECGNCLEKAQRGLPACCRRGAKILYPSCNIRYEDYKFYDSPPTSLPSPPRSGLGGGGGGGEGSNKSRTVAIIAASIAVGFILIALTSFFLVRRRKQHRELAAHVDDEIGREESLQFDFGVIRTATDDFSDANMLGQGGFGAVYKGTLSDGREIAVKRLSMNSGQGEMEFKNEVLLVAKLQHRNLVRLLGFSFQGDERLLIYEFLPNASLDHFIFHPVKRLQLDWKARSRILVGIARGLQYLHEDSRLRIIHRDLKAANILLDGDMNAKITDFGIARLVEMDQTQANTSKVIGTYGYMAPEYALHGIFSVKSDVFSFGVLALEIISGRKSYSFTNEEDSEDLLTFAWKNWKEGTASNVIDPALMDGLMAREITKCLNVALICVQENAEHRPSMASVVVMLSTNDVTLPVPVRPASYIPSRTGETDPLLQLTNSSSSLNELTDSIQGCPR